MLINNRKLTLQVHRFDNCPHWKSFSSEKDRVTPKIPNPVVPKCAKVSKIRDVVRKERKKYIYIYIHKEADNLVGREDMSGVFKMQMQMVASSAMVLPDRGCGPRRTRGFFVLRFIFLSFRLSSFNGWPRKTGEEGALLRSSRRVSRGILLRTRISDWCTSGNARGGRF